MRADISDKSFSALERHNQLLRILTETIQNAEIKTLVERPWKTQGAKAVLGKNLYFGPAHGTERTLFVLWCQDPKI